MTLVPAPKRCEVVYALPDTQICIEVQVPAQATVTDVLAAARDLAASQASNHAQDIPWETAAVGIFGDRCARTDIPQDGDRIEIYRELLKDPRRARLAAMDAERRAARRRGR